MITVASPMEDLIQQMEDFNIPEPGTLVEGEVVTVQKNLILIDINGVTTGIISGKETKDSDGTIDSIKEGDMLSAYVIESENEDGYVVLSLRKANQEKTWKRFLDAYENSDVISVKANEANKGGLLLDIAGIKGFIPVSQLAPMHYPRVNDADANQILARLQRLVGEDFKVKIINIDKENGKLILSERAAMEAQRQESLDKLEVGQKVTGTISGIVKFGIFVAFNGLEGLVHISEIAWGHVKNPSDFGKIGDKVEVEVIGVEGDKISLSMKRLVDDPWLEAAKKYKLGTIVQGEVNRITPFGAFVKLSEEINGLIHVTEIDPPVKEPGDVLKIGSVVTAKVIAVEPDEHRVGLSIKALQEKSDVGITQKDDVDEDTEPENDTEPKNDTEPEKVEPLKEEAPKKAKKIVKKKVAEKDKPTATKTKKKPATEV